MCGEYGHEKRNLICHTVSSNENVKKREIELSTVGKNSGVNNLFVEIKWQLSIIVDFLERIFNGRL